MCAARLWSRVTVCSYSKLFQVPGTCAQLFVCQSYLQSGLKKDNPNRWGPGLEGLGGPFLGERRGKDLTRPVRSSHLGFGKHFCTLGRSVLDWSTPDLEGAPGTSLATAGPDLGRRGMDGISA